MVDAKRLEAELGRLEDILHEACSVLRTKNAPVERIKSAHALVEDVEERLLDLLIDLEGDRDDHPV